MIHLNENPETPDWSYRRPCSCDCRCADLRNWLGHARRNCGCCPTSCTRCTHEQPARWDGDDN